jgi:hypothetical protein
MSAYENGAADLFPTNLPPLRREEQSRVDTRPARARTLGFIMDWATDEVAPPLRTESVTKEPI